MKFNFATDTFGEMRTKKIEQLRRQLQKRSSTPGETIYKSKVLLDTSLTSITTKDV